MDYKLYFLDHENRISRRVDLDCEDDEHASQRVADHVDGHAMELWQGSRRVASFPRL